MTQNDECQEAMARLKQMSTRRRRAVFRQVIGQATGLSLLDFIRGVGLFKVEKDFVEAVKEAEKACGRKIMFAEFKSMLNLDM